MELRDDYQRFVGARFHIDVCPECGVLELFAAAWHADGCSEPYPLVKCEAEIVALVPRAVTNAEGEGKE